MSRASYCHQLLVLIGRLRLDEFGPRAQEFASYRWLLESSKISDGQAFGILHMHAQYIEERRICPDPTRYPTEEELYADGRPEIENGTIRSTELRTGFNIDPPVHTLTVGETGTGKSTFLRKQVIAMDDWARRTGRRLSIIVIDGKNDFTDIPRLGPHWRHLSATNGLRVGINAPASVRDLRHWISQVSEILAASLNLIASTTVLANWIRRLLPLLNPPDTRVIERWPSLSLILEMLRQAPHDLDGKPQYAETLITSLDGIVQAAGPLIDCEAGLDVEAHLLNEGLSAVISVANLKPASLKWIVTDLLAAQVLYSRLESGVKTDQTDLALVIDEADALISADTDMAYFDGLSMLGQLLKQVRELGCAVFLGATVMANISRFVREDVGRIAVFNQASREAKWESARTLGLPPGAEDFLSTLKRGECIMRQSLIAWPHPMRVIADYVPANRTPKTTPFDSHPFLPGRSIRDLPNVREHFAKIVNEHNMGKARRAKARQQALSDEAKALLEKAAAFPFTPVARLWEFIHVSAALKQMAIRKELEDAKLLEFEEERISSTNMAMTRITDKGWDSLGKSAPVFRGGGGLVHQHCEHWLAMVGKLRGYQTEIEWLVPNTNHRVDAAWFVGEMIHAFEVSISCSENLVRHVDACLRQSSAVTTVTIVVPRKKMIDEIRRQLTADPTAAPLLDRVRYGTIAPFLKEIWP